MAKRFLKRNIDQSVSTVDLINEVQTPDRVDINVLKSRIREEENKRTQKNYMIILSCLGVLVLGGLYVSFL
ncbi:hypothetical protein [Candidatus Pelagibacter sp.]|uniref:hypothetical protein n=1 Tax=Candidatus Pelagibacter sp. TaxID=2024849 RepID=UPI003F863930